MNTISHPRRRYSPSLRGGVTLAAILSLAPLTWAASLEDIEKDLVAKQDKIKSMSAKMETRSDMKMGGNTIKSKQAGTMEWVRKDDKFLHRYESEGQSIMKMGDQEMKTDSKMLMISDGEHMYTLTEQMGQKTAMKMKADPAQSQNVASMFKAWKKDHNLKVLPDEKVEGRDCYVIEATPKKEQPNNPISKQVFYLCKKTGTMAKMVGYDKQGKQNMQMVLKDITINPDIKPERFKFKAPEGVEVMDMTKMGAGGMGGAAQ